ncbi:MAG: ATP-binding protein [Deltaproteobacteria bacterium]|nr:ATP-binding protein [Deltaproteobacteria bacterium]
MRHLHSNDVRAEVRNRITDFPQESALWRMAVYERNRSQLVIAARITLGNFSQPSKFYHYANGLGLAQYTTSVKDVEALISGVENIHFADNVDFAFKVTYWNRLIFLGAGEGYASVCADSPSYVAFGEIELEQEVGTFLSLNSRVYGGGPIFPNIREAIADHVFGIRSRDQGEVAKMVSLVVPTWGPRICRVTVEQTHLTVNVESPRNSNHDSCMKLFVESFLRTSTGTHQSRQQVDGGVVAILTDSRPEWLIMHLVDEKGCIADEVEVNPKDYRPSDIRVALGTTSLQLEVDSAIKAGECKTIEFKRILSNKQNDLAESIAAFANTAGGIIIIGVDDHSNVVGFHNDRAADTVQNIVSDCIDPAPDVTVSSITVSNKPVLVIDVKKSENPPCFLNGKIVIRANATDRGVSRAEFDEIFEFKQEDDRYDFQNRR